MELLLTFLLSFIFIIITISWIVPRIICWIARRKFNISVKIGKLSLPYFKVCDLHLYTKGYTVCIDEISLKSSFFNSDLTKLITLVIKDVRINKDISQSQNHNGTDDPDSLLSRDDRLDFRNKKVPQIINNITQFMAVHVYNVSAMLLRSQGGPGCLTHATASELHIDGSLMKSAQMLLVSVNVAEASAKVLRHAGPHCKDACLAEFSFRLAVELTLSATKALCVQKLEVNISQTSAVINEGFYALAQERTKFRPSSHLNNCRINKEDDDDNDIIQRLSPICPKVCKIHIKDTSLKGFRDNGQIEYRSSLKSLDLNYRAKISNDIEDESVPLNFTFYISDLLLQNSREKLIVMKSFGIEAKMENFIINVYVKLNTLLLTYDHDVIHGWVRGKFLQETASGRATGELRLVARRNTLLEKALGRVVVNACAELCQVSAVVRLDQRSSAVGFTHVRVMLDQALEGRGTTYEARLPALLLGDRKWQVEVLAESVWWSFGECWSRESNVSKAVHVWGTPVYLGMALIKVGAGMPKQVKVAALLDTLQLEWSIELADYVLTAVRCLKQYRFSFKRNKTVNKNPDDLKIVANTVISQFNCFFQTQTTEYFVCRLNTVTLDKTGAQTNYHLDELKIFSVRANAGGYYSCIRSEDISKYRLFVKGAYLEVVPGQLSLHLIDDIVTHWSTNFHLKGLHLVRDVCDFLAELSDETGSSGSVPDDDDGHQRRRFFSCTVKGHFRFHVEVSEKHSAKVAFDEMQISSSSEDLTIENKATVISIDGADMFTIRGVQFCRVTVDEAVREERADVETFRLPWNPRTWRLSVDLLRAVFPYEHNFAETVHDRLFSIIKWLRTIHGLKRKGPVPPDSPLPADWIVHIKEFLFEMSDDPFEVKLRDNFELLEDEYHESLKRVKMLKEKVSALCKTHLHLPAAKVEELYSNLKRKDTEIYIQRSKQMLRQSPARTRLFAWSMTQVEIMTLADPSMHGTEAAVRVMREIDGESPWPEEGLEFSTLWCRVVSMRCREWKFQLRDFPQPLLHIRGCYIAGTLIGAEQVAPRRATRNVVIELGEPFEPYTVERGMLPLKFYHDFNCDIESYRYAFGPCWEPVIAMCNLCFERIVPPSRDPSPPLSFWDKMRLLLHGRLTMVVQQLTVLLHASLDPYNTTEEMEITWTQAVMDWTNAKFVYKGDLSIFVRTASKYDDCKLLYMPNLKLIVGIEWICLGNPNDHHSVIQCAPNKIPEYSSNQVHDSFRAFRSQNVNLRLSIETRPLPAGPSPTSLCGAFDCPVLLLYGSTLRWIENLKLILSGVTRPTRRGRIFGNLRPRKIQLSRHYRRIHLQVALHRFQVCYWMSYAMQGGCELLGGRLSSSSEHSLSLVPIDDGLTHRPKAEWSIVYMTSDLNDSEIWLKSALQERDDAGGDGGSVKGFAGSGSGSTPTVEKCYCLSVAKVSYGRETALPADRDRDNPVHRLVVYDLRGAWTKSNRNVVFSLFDTFMKNKQMKKNLSTEALKGFRKDTNTNTNTTPLKRRNTDASETPPNSSILGMPTSVQAVDGNSGGARLQSGVAASMLQQLIAEVDNNAVVYSDDLASAPRQQYLQGVQACQEDDVLYRNWQIALVNGQVLLKGCETRGYVILSAAKAEIIQRIHRPVWRDRTLVSKTTWSGTLECMQYYATVNAGLDTDINDNIMWLTVDNIQEKESTEISEPSEVPNMVGSGVSVGAVVSDTVGPSSSSQLQRIVSRCKCEFFYAGYGDISVDLKAAGEAPPPVVQEEGAGGPWDVTRGGVRGPVDAFTLMHHDLEVCTNSLQYAMLLDVVNNLLLYVEPHRKEALERLARMRFRLQLQSFEDQRRPILDQQTVVRNLVSKLRRLEKDTYLVSKALAEQPDDALQTELDRLERLVNECKNQLGNESEELDAMVSCYKEAQLLADSRLATTRSDKPPTMVRASEICFKHAQWRLTEADGQIGIADLVLSNFLYTKNSKSNDSVEHLLELGYLRMTNLLPNEIYKEVLCPTEIQYDMPIEHKKVLRVFCRERPPVGGISVKEHFEINCVPLTIGLTKKFYNTMMKFCFPEREAETTEYQERSNDEFEPENKGKKSKSRRGRDSSFYVHYDDVEKMKERAEKNKLFVYIKIPEVPVRVSYKGSKEKNLEDLRDVSLTIPTLEYHNMTWTWLDLLMAVRNDTKKVILSQAIKQKLQIKRNTGCLDEASAPDEEDKARILFGSRHAPENKSIRRGVGGVFKFGK